MTATSTTTRTTTRTSGSAKLDAERLRRDFPALEQQVHGKPLVYLDNAATTQKPAGVIETVERYYRLDNANIHRGVHELSQRATAAYEAARAKAQTLINAPAARQIIFTRGTTEAINLVAASHVRPSLREGDEILITHLEHHSNIVPWQIVCEEVKAKLRVAPIDDRGQVVMDEFRKLLGRKTKFVAVAHVSNALGTVNPVAEMVKLAHENGATVLVDGAQAVAHAAVDVQALDCDFYAFSGHKLYGPTGVGVLYGREELLNAMPPYQGGGDMIRSVTFEKTTYNELPYKFEAGTPNIAGVIGLGAAIDYVQGAGLDAIARHEHDLVEYGTKLLAKVPGLRLIGTAADKAAILSFVLDGVHAHDVGTILDSEGVAVRTGHHCAQPVMDRFGVPATARASLALYNTRGDLDALAAALAKVVAMFK